MAKIFILCGGKGRRLEPLTRQIPKPLMMLHGKPILQRIIEFYQQQNFKNFVVCTGYKSDAIKQFIAQTSFDAEIEISNMGEKASMLKRIYGARQMMDDIAIITYGDTFIDLNLHEVVKEHYTRKANITLIIAKIRNPFGIVTLGDHNKVLSFEEKPLLSYYIGLMILNRSVLNNIKSDYLDMPNGAGLVSLFKENIMNGGVHAYDHQGLQLTFNTQQEHEFAEKKWIQFFTQSEHE